MGQVFVVVVVVCRAGGTGEGGEGLKGSTGFFPFIQPVVKPITQRLKLILDTNL